MKQLLALLLCVLPGAAYACTGDLYVIYCPSNEDMEVPQDPSLGGIPWTQAIGGKSNWDYVTGDGDSSCEKTVTFSAAFASIPDVTADCIGATNAVPANRGDARTAPTLECKPQVLKTNQFTAVVIDVTGANISTNTRVLFCWKAKPAGSD